MTPTISDVLDLFVSIFAAFGVIAFYLIWKHGKPQDRETLGWLLVIVLAVLAWYVNFR